MKTINTNKLSWEKPSFNFKSEHCRELKTVLIMHLINYTPRKRQRFPRMTILPKKQLMPPLKNPRAEQINHKGLFLNTDIFKQ